MQSDLDSLPKPRPASLAPVGFMVGLISLAAIVALLHHPVAHSVDSAGLLASIRTQSTMDQAVHGALAVIFGLLTVAMFLFASRLGVWRMPVLSGLVCWACAFMLMVLAVMTDGFVVPAIAARCGPSASSSCAGEAFTMLRLGALQIEWLTRFSFSALALAILAWATALLRTPDVPRWAGLVGLGSGVLQLVALFATSSRLNPHSLVVLLTANAGWSLVVATLMIMQRGPFQVTTAPGAPH